MNTIKNPARSRPLSANVKRLMKMARESPQNPAVEKIERDFSTRDLAYCDMQGNIFMAAVDRGIAMEQFAPMFMYSQLAAVIDFSFFHPGLQDEGSLPDYLQMPMLLKSPDLIVDVLLWIEGIVRKLGDGESARAAVVREVNTDAPAAPAIPAFLDIDDSFEDTAALTEKYAYAYWLGYIYRYESLLHEEASRMVFEVLDEPLMRETYEQLDFGDTDLADCAGEICKRLDLLIINRL